MNKKKSKDKTHQAIQKQATRLHDNKTKSKDKTHQAIQKQATRLHDKNIQNEASIFHHSFLTIQTTNVSFKMKIMNGQKKISKHPVKWQCLYSYSIIVRADHSHNLKQWS
jgi:transposase